MSNNVALAALSFDIICDRWSLHKYCPDAADFTSVALHPFMSHIVVCVLDKHFKPNIWAVFTITEGNVDGSKYIKIYRNDLYCCLHMCVFFVTFLLFSSGKHECHIVLGSNMFNVSIKRSLKCRLFVNE